jgi:uncharacterized protein (DUF1684 family)
MKRSTLLISIGVVVVLAFIYLTVREETPPEDYIARIEKERQEKDAFMKSSEGSPFRNDTVPFEGLNYFPVDERYRVKARLEPIEKKKVVILATSDGLEQRYLEYAFAHFRLHDTDCRLLLLEVMDTGPQRGKLFLAFADETSGQETYGAGRYLDVKKIPAAKTTELDFNRAYNPYCAYNDTFSCPLPPRENLLKVPIYAGEKNYH